MMSSVGTVVRETMPTDDRAEHPANGQFPPMRQVGLARHELIDLLIQIVALAAAA